jgi:hypothetical protein
MTKTTIIALAATAFLASPLCADPAYVGLWGFEGSNCIDPIEITEDKIYDSVNLECVITSVHAIGAWHTIKAQCANDLVNFRFTVKEDTLTLLHGVDFGSGLPVTFHRCAAQLNRDRL